MLNFLFKIFCQLKKHSLKSLILNIKFKNYIVNFWYTNWTHKMYKEYHSTERDSKLIQKRTRFKDK